MIHEHAPKFRSEINDSLYTLQSLDPNNDTQTISRTSTVPVSPANPSALQVIPPTFYLTGLHSICHVPYATLSISFFLFLQCPHLYICIVCMYICLNCIHLYLNVYCQCLMLTVCTKGLRVTQFQFSVCMCCTCGRIDNKADLTWLDFRSGLRPNVHPS